jgi:ABC-type polysaccharide/polyol phosphate transport system ATPase subunit
MTPAITFDNVSKSYRLGAGASLRAALTSTLSGALRRNGHAARNDNLFWALRDASFSVPRGHALGLIGPNGAGKTTVLKILADIVQPTSGRVEVNGRTSALIELGAGFHPDLTGRENVYLNAAILGLARKEVDRLFDRIVEFSGLERFIDTPVKRYSSGMYVRLGFSVAAHVEPEVLLVDEVLAVGDAQFRQKCAQRIQELQKRGTSIVFVAHNLFLVKSICDLGIFLTGGQIAAQGDVAEAINAYESWMHSQTAAAASAAQKAGPGAVVGGGSVVDILAVEVKRLDGETGPVLLHSEPVEICIQYEARQALPEANLVLRVVRGDGITSCMVRTADYGLAPGDLQPGQGRISVVIDPLQLTGGAYLIDARLTGPVDGVPLAQGHSKWFQVEGLSISHVESSGVFVPNLVRVDVERNLLQQTDLTPQPSS